MFEKPLNLQGSLRLMSMLNGIDVQRWEALAVAANLPRKQFISGNWTIHGNVYVKRNVTGSGLLDGISVKGLAEELAEREEGVKSVAAEIRVRLHIVCNYKLYTIYCNVSTFFICRKTSRAPAKTWMS